MIRSRHRRESWNVQNFVPMVFLLSFSFLSGSCSEEETHASRKGSSGTEENVVTQDYFSVKLTDDTKFTYYLNEKDNFGVDCKMDSVNQNTDMTCIVDVNEGDLYFYPMKLQVNVPAGMCYFLQVHNYFYYNFSSGYGPTWFGLKKIYNADDELTGVKCTDDSKIPSWGECKDDGLEAWAEDDGTVTCRYDYTKDDSDYPNCCFGNGQLYTLNEGGSNDGTASTTNQIWGEEAWDKCLGGPAIHPSWPKDDSGWPSSLRYEAWDKGKNMNLEVTRNISTPNSSGSIHIANHYEGAPDATNIPHAISPGTDRGINHGINSNNNETALQDTQDAYEFRCLDKADEVINRIRVYVRDWNTYSEWLSYGSSAGTTGDPDVKARGISTDTRGSETSGDCNVEYGLVGYCNDFFDWDDVNTNEASSSSTGDFPMEVIPGQFYDSNWPEYDTPLELDY